MAALSAITCHGWLPNGKTIHGKSATFGEIREAGRTTMADTQDMPDLFAPVSELNSTRASTTSVKLPQARATSTTARAFVTITALTYKKRRSTTLKCTTVHAPLTLNP